MQPGRPRRANPKCVMALPRLANGMVRLPELDPGSRCCRRYRSATSGNRSKTLRSYVWRLPCRLPALHPGGLRPDASLSVPDGQHQTVLFSNGLVRKSAASSSIASCRVPRSPRSVKKRSGSRLGRFQAQLQSARAGVLTQPR